jgi:hypothetical protein
VTSVVEVCNDIGMEIEFVKAQCTISTQRAEKWIWLAWFSKPTPARGDITSDHTWCKLEESQLSGSDWARLRYLVGSSKPSVVGGGGVNHKASWRRWHIRRSENGWNVVPESEPWPSVTT